MSTPTTVENFHGGIIDEFDGAAPHFAQRQRNFFVDDARKLYERNGTKLWSNVQLPTAERVSGLRVFQNLTKGSTAEFTAFLYSHHKLWVSTGGNVTEAVGPAALTELKAKCPGEAFVEIGANLSIASRCTMQLNNQHVYVAFQTSNLYSQQNFHPSPRKIWPYGDTVDSWKMANVGVPYYNSLNWPVYLAGGGAANYVYYYTYFHTYTARGLTFTVESAPQFARPIGGIATINGGNTVSFSGFTYPSNSVGTFNDSYLVEVVVNDGFGIRIYRTKSNETTPRLAGTIVYPATAFVDNVPDASLGAAIYTADGTSPYDEPPPCKLMRVVGDVAYFSGFDIDATTYAVDSVPTPPMSSIIQSVPGVPDSAPSDYVINTPTPPVGLEDIDYYPIVFCRGSVWRIEGQIDSFGNGSPVLRPISETVGLLHQRGVIKTDRGLIFASDDGAYFTDGFTAKKITNHLNKFWGQLWNRMTQADIEKIDGIYQPSQKMFFFSTNQAWVNALPNTVICGDMENQTEDGGASVSEHIGQDNETSLGNSFLPTALEVMGDTLLMGDWAGYVQALRTHAHAAEDVVNSDVAVDPAVAAVNFGLTPVYPDYISAALGLAGGGIFKNWVTKILVRFKLPFTMTKIMAEIDSYNDGNFRDDASAHGKVLKEVRELAVPAYRRIYTVARRFAKGQIRCLYKQIRISKAFTILYASIPGGVRAYATVTTSGAGNTALLGSGTWPTDVAGQQLTLAGDGYTLRWVILTVSGNTLTLADPGNTLPTVAGSEWEIKGYPKDCKIGIHGYTVLSTQIEGVEDVYHAADGGGN